MDSKFLIIALFLTTLASSSVSCTTNVTQQNTYSTFVKTSCSSATYPSVCLKSLLPYASAVKTNPLTLVKVALYTSLRSANATLTTVSQLSKTKRITKFEAAILKDCIYDLKDSMSEIKDSIKALSGISKSYDKNFVISNAQTWTSAAITDENSCLDGFSDRNVSPAIYKKTRNSILSLARVSSNALYLINHLSV
ncbi:plant invertase/pectin methylesterase inhibitor superfamily protein [Artemisia annua]|uniref:Plant invertase/pectin methylesterase inhibitor superfamily protein n=1 Tax=Artemisia annua TaxID=35608 RepID=A0A2U1KPL8_ARTAN|nr:plant invertase/pectin methylesterase inhibitor superfamily protein [Artemisia annua]